MKKHIPGGFHCFDTGERGFEGEQVSSSARRIGAVAWSSMLLACGTVVRGVSSPRMIEYNPAISLKSKLHTLIRSPSRVLCT